MAVLGGDSKTGNLRFKKKQSDPWELPSQTSFNLKYHCMSQMDSLTLVITGGMSGTAFSKQTYFYNLKTQKWDHENVPPLKTPQLLSERIYHGCSFITDLDGQPTAIIAGGSKSVDSTTSSTSFDSVEVYNRALGTWESGPKLKEKMHAFQVKYYLTQIILFSPCHK